MQPLTYTRKQASAQGNVHYTGRPCKKCSSTLRYVNNRSCVDCEIGRNKFRQENIAEWRSVNKQRLKVTRRFSTIKAKYGLTKEDYLAMLSAQDNKCKICKINDIDAPHGTLCVDHCHATGKVRGLLCHHCNAAIGHLKESESLLLSAIEYLKGDV